MKSITIREIIMFGIMLIMSFFLFTKKWNHSELEQQKARSDERIKEYHRQDSALIHVIDSLKNDITTLKGNLINSKKDTILIIKKYEKIIGNIILLNADKSISYLSKRLSQESRNR